MIINQTGFQIVRPKSPELQPFWATVDAVSGGVVYVGQIVRRAYGASDDGVTAMGVATLIGDTTNKAVPLGIVVGTNNYPGVATYTRLFPGSSTVPFVTEFITNSSTTTPTITTLSTQSRVLTEGPAGKGSKVAMVKIAPITPTTIIRGRIFNAAYGTAPTLLTATSAMTDGLLTANMTTNACEFTPVEGTCTIYCRTGTNAGAYRTTKDTSTTAPQVLTPFERNSAIGDTFVRASLPSWGLGLLQTDARSLFVDNSTSGGTTDYFYINVHKLDLRDAGYEFVEFSFSTIHFDPYRA